MGTLGGLGLWMISHDRDRNDMDDSSEPTDATPPPPEPPANAQEAAPEPDQPLPPTFEDHDKLETNSNEDAAASFTADPPDEPPAPGTPTTPGTPSKKKVTWPDQLPGQVVDGDFLAKVIGDSTNGGKNVKKKTPTVLLISDEDRDNASAWCKRQWGDSDSGVRRSVSVVGLILYAFGGSGIFYAIEQEALGYRYWDALAFVNSVYTTIGYGTIAPRTTGGRVFTIIYAIFGVPLFLNAASDLSFLLVYVTGVVWLYIRRFRRYIKHNLLMDQKRRQSIVIPKNEQFKHFMHKDKNVPLPVAFFCFFAWWFLSSCYFYYVQDTESQRWTFFEAVYFFFISVVTIGLGDFNVHDTRRTTLDYSFIVGGIALFSFCIRLFTQKLEHIDDEVIKLIMDEYRASLEFRYDAFDSAWHMQASEMAQRKEIRRLIKQKSGWMNFFIGKSVEQKMLAEYRKRANMRLETTQTQIHIRDVALDVKPDLADAQTMAGQSYIKPPTPPPPPQPAPVVPDVTVVKMSPQGSLLNGNGGGGGGPSTSRGGATTASTRGGFVRRSPRGRGGYSNRGQRSPNY